MNSPVFLLVFNLFKPHKNLIVLDIYKKQLDFFHIYCIIN